MKGSGKGNKLRKGLIRGETKIISSLLNDIPLKVWSSARMFAAIPEIIILSISISFWSNAVNIVGAPFWYNFLIVGSQVLWRVGLGSLLSSCTSEFMQIAIVGFVILPVARASW